MVSAEAKDKAKGEGRKGKERRTCSKPFTAKLSNPKMSRTPTTAGCGPPPPPGVAGEVAAASEALRKAQSVATVHLKRRWYTVLARASRAAVASLALSGTTVASPLTKMTREHRARETSASSTPKHMAARASAFAFAFAPPSSFASFAPPTTTALSSSSPTMSTLPRCSRPARVFMAPSQSAAVNPTRCIDSRSAANWAASSTPSPRAAQAAAASAPAAVVYRYALGAAAASARPHASRSAAVAPARSS